MASLFHSFNGLTLAIDLKAIFISETKKSTRDFWSRSAKRHKRVSEMA